jgi:NAD(P)H-flavin reductase
LLLTVNGERISQPQIYAAGQDPKHPKGDKMSQHLDRLRLGDKVDVKGPVGRFLYEGREMAEIGGRPLPHVERLGMLAGGTGITPMYQLVQAILRDPQDATRCSLLFANR